MADPVKPVVVHLICSSGFYGAERVVANLCAEIKDVELLVLCLANRDISTEVFEGQLKTSNTNFLCIKNQIIQALKVLLEIKHQKKKLLFMHMDIKKLLSLASLASSVNLSLSSLNMGLQNVTLNPAATTGSRCPYPAGPISNIFSAYRKRSTTVIWSLECPHRAWLAYPML